jgi:hypothetical protein
MSWRWTDEQDLVLVHIVARAKSPRANGFVLRMRDERPSIIHDIIRGLLSVVGR